MSTTTYFSMPEVASQLNVSVATVRRWIDEKGLPAQRVGKSIRIPAVAFDEWLAHRERCLNHHPRSRGGAR